MLVRFDTIQHRSKIYYPADGFIAQRTKQPLIPALDGGFYIPFQHGFQYFHPQQMARDTTAAPFILKHLIVGEQFAALDNQHLNDTVVEVPYTQNTLCFQFGWMVFSAG